MVWDLLVYLIIGGIIGARLWHVLTPPPSSIAQGFTTQYYLTHPLDALAIWKGGLGIPGTILGGLVAMYLYCRSHREIGFLEWTDIAAPSLALGQAIGRWGNFFNQELYGAPTNLPWKIYIDPAHRLAGYAELLLLPPLVRIRIDPEPGQHASAALDRCAGTGPQLKTRRRVQRLLDRLSTDSVFALISCAWMPLRSSASTSIRL